jgi:hypothetical protein
MMKRLSAERIAQLKGWAIERGRPCADFSRYRGVYPPKCTCMPCACFYHAAQKELNSASSSDV